MNWILTRRIFLVLVSLLAFGLAACGTSGTSGSTTPSISTLKLGTLTAVTLTDGAPFASITASGEWTGYEVALLQKIANNLGLQLALTGKDFDTLIPSVSGNLADIAFVSIADTDKRRQVVDFTLPDYTGTNNLVVLNSSPIPSGPQQVGQKVGVEVTGKRVGVIQSTLEAQYAQTYFTGATLVTFPNNNAAILGLLAKSVDSIFIDGQDAYVYQGQYPVHTAFTAVDPANRGGAIVINKSRTQLRMAINTQLRKFLADGTMEQLLKQYDPKEPSGPIIAFLKAYYAKFPSNTYPY